MTTCFWFNVKLM